MDLIQNQDPIIREFLQGIASVRPQIHRLVLFGSRARGTHRIDSDYDLMLVVSKKNSMLLDTLYEAVMEIVLAHGRLVSLKIVEAREFDRLQTLQTPFMQKIASEGVSLG